MQYIVLAAEQCYHEKCMHPECNTTQGAQSQNICAKLGLPVVDKMADRPLAQGQVASYSFKIKPDETKKLKISPKSSTSYTKGHIYEYFSSLLP